MGSEDVSEEVGDVSEWRGGRWEEINEGLDWKAGFGLEGVY